MRKWNSKKKILSNNANSKDIYEVIQKVIRLNYLLDKHLDLNKLKQIYAKQVIYKIIFENLLIYKDNFSIWDNQIDLQKFETYLKEITDFVFEKIYIKKRLEKKDILKLHYIIMKNLPLEKIDNIWHFRQYKMKICQHNNNITGKNVTAFQSHEMKIYWYNTAGKLIATFATKSKYIEKEFNLQLNNLNANVLNWDDKNNLLSIIIFIHNIINAIHPFENWNWKVFRILLDVLLFKINFFPVFILKKEHRKKLFNKVIANYLDNKQKEVFLTHFLELMIDIYSNYKM